MNSQDLFTLLEPAVTSQGLGLVEVTVVPGGRRSTLRIVVHSAKGVTHGDCSRVTRAAENALEAASAAPSAYVLEVSSPGLDRRLKEPREFDLFRGAAVRVLLRDRESPEREVIGTVVESRGEEVVVRRQDGEEIAIPWDRVAKAKLIPEAPERDAVRGKEQ